LKNQKITKKIKYHKNNYKEKSRKKLKNRSLTKLKKSISYTIFVVLYLSNLLVLSKYFTPRFMGAFRSLIIHKIEKLKNFEAILLELQTVQKSYEEESKQANFSLGDCVALTLWIRGGPKTDPQKLMFNNETRSHRISIGARSRRRWAR